MPKQELKRATFDQLVNKPRAEQEVSITLPTQDGGSEEVTLLFRAIGTADYDRLVSKHPPNTEQRASGETFNIHTFAPALLAKVCVEPDLSEKQWGELWNSPDWNRGENSTLYLTAVALCNRGFELVPLSSSGSGTTEAST